MEYQDETDRASNAGHVGVRGGGKPEPVAVVAGEPEGKVVTS